LQAFVKHGAWRIAPGVSLALACCAMPARAMSLGAPQVLSISGQRIEARIPVHATRGEALGAACFALLRDDAPGAASLSDASLELRRHARGADLFVRGTTPPGADAFAFGVAIRCRAAKSASVSRFSVPARIPAARLPVVARMPARAGDTLATIAHALFPDDALVRARYLQALRVENPPLASLNEDAPLARGTRLALPDLHAFAQTIPARAAAPRDEEQERRASRPRALAVAAPRTGAASDTPTFAGKTLPAGATGGGFQLRLSAPVLDLSPSKAMDDRRRAELRERLLVLESDDRTSQMLAMRENIRRLESQVKALQLKLAAMPAAAPPAAKQEAPRPPRIVPQRERDPPWYAEAWWIAALLAVLGLAFALHLMRRRPSAAQDDPLEGDLAPLDSAMPEAPDTEAPEAQEAEGPREDEASTPDEPPFIEPVPAATRIPAEDNAELRRRYLEERFPEIANGALVLEDPRSVVNAARLLYEDAAAPRAIELLHFAIEQDCAAIAPWLALFDIFRRERLTGEYAQLAARFAEHHGKTAEWPKVRSVGRSIDPDHPLYEGAEFGAADPQAEGWLRRPGGDAPHPLAAKLRGRLMARAGIVEEDLRADPTPALRKAEMFSVA
jgi:hypothetical protein